MNQQIKKTYPLSWVVMQNSIQECFKSMSVDEKRILILASPIARTTNATEQDAIVITAENFAQECNIKVHSAYKSLVQASRSLIKRYFCYLDEKGRKTYCNWVIRARYEEGSVSICFPDEVLLMLKEFDKLNPYTKYKKNIVLSLKKDYSFDFYHLAKKHQLLGKFEMSLSQMNDEFGLPESYQDLSNLKKRVIKPSLDEINANTDIELTYENIKKGRSVIGFKFVITEKPKLQNEHINRDESTVDVFHKLTEKQLDMFSSKLADLPAVQAMAHIGEDMTPFVARLRTMLMDAEQQKVLLPYLKEVGYVAA